MEKFQMLQKLLIYVVQWLYLLVFFHLVWEYHQVDYLSKGLARSTNGRFVFIPPKSNIDVYVGEQLQKTLQPSITNVHVQWKLGVNVQSSPTQSPPVYVNDCLIVYALTNDKTIPFDHNSSVEV
jgi:hypothetical protein